jgi:hypothetical protein
MNRADLSIIEERRLLDFISDALDIGPPEDVAHACPHCACLVRYPKAVAAADFDRMAGLIRMVERYADDKGITAKMIADVMAQCHIAVAMKSKPAQGFEKKEAAVSWTVHYITPENLAAKRYETLCKCSHEFEATTERAKVECKRCREILGERVTWTKSVNEENT